MARVVHACPGPWPRHGVLAENGMQTANNHVNLAPALLLYYRTRSTSCAWLAGMNRNASQQQSRYFALAPPLPTGLVLPAAHAQPRRDEGQAQVRGAAALLACAVCSLSVERAAAEQCKLAPHLRTRHQRWEPTIAALLCSPAAWCSLERKAWMPAASPASGTRYVALLCLPAAMPCNCLRRCACLPQHRLLGSLAVSHLRRTGTFKMHHCRRR